MPADVRRQPAGFGDGEHDGRQRPAGDAIAGPIVGDQEPAAVEAQIDSCALLADEGFVSHSIGTNPLLIAFR